MPIKQRLVSSAGDSGTEHPILLASKDSEGEEVVADRTFVDLVGCMKQFAKLATFSNEIFSELTALSGGIQTRLDSLHARTAKLQRAVPKLQVTRTAFSIHGDERQHTRQMLQSPQSQHLLPSSMPASLKSRYESIKQPPNFHMLDTYAPYLNLGKAKCVAHRYSNPNFFVDQWVAAQEKRMQQLDRERKTQRAEKKLRKMQRAEPLPERTAKRRATVNWQERFMVDGKAVHREETKKRGTWAAFKRSSLGASIPEEEELDTTSSAGVPSSAKAACVEEEVEVEAGAGARTAQAGKATFSSTSVSPPTSNSRPVPLPSSPSDSPLSSPASSQATSFNSTRTHVAGAGAGADSARSSQTIHYSGLYQGGESGGGEVGGRNPSIDEPVAGAMAKLKLEFLSSGSPSGGGGSPNSTCTEDVTPGRRSAAEGDMSPLSSLVARLPRSKPAPPGAGAEVGVGARTGADVAGKSVAAAVLAVKSDGRTLTPIKRRRAPPPPATAIPAAAKASAASNPFAEVTEKARRGANPFGECSNPFGEAETETGPGAGMRTGARVSKRGSNPFVDSSNPYDEEEIGTGAVAGAIAGTGAGAAGKVKPPAPKAPSAPDCTSVSAAVPVPIPLISIPPPVASPAAVATAASAPQPPPPSGDGDGDSSSEDEEDAEKEVEKERSESMGAQPLLSRLRPSYLDDSSPAPPTQKPMISDPTFSKPRPPPPPSMRPPPPESPGYPVSPGSPPSAYPSSPDVRHVSSSSPSSVAPPRPPPAGPPPPKSGAGSSAGAEEASGAGLASRPPHPAALAMAQGGGKLLRPRGNSPIRVHSPHRGRGSPPPRPPPPVPASAPSSVSAPAPVSVPSPPRSPFAAPQGGGSGGSLFDGIRLGAASLRSTPLQRSPPPAPRDSMMDMIKKGPALRRTTGGPGVEGLSGVALLESQLLQKKRNSSLGGFGSSSVSAILERRKFMMAESSSDSDDSDEDWA